MAPLLGPYTAFVYLLGILSLAYSAPVSLHQSHVRPFSADVRLVQAGSSIEEVSHTNIKVQPISKSLSKTRRDIHASLTSTSIEHFGRFSLLSSNGGLNRPVKLQHYSSSKTVYVDLRRRHRIRNWRSKGRYIRHSQAQHPWNSHHHTEKRRRAPLRRPRRTFKVWRHHTRHGRHYVQGRPQHGAHRSKSRSGHPKSLKHRTHRHTRRSHQFNIVHHRYGPYRRRRKYRRGRHRYRLH